MSDSIHATTPSVDEVLGSFSVKSREARRRYREFVAAGMREQEPVDLSGGGLIRSNGGWESIKRFRAEHVVRIGDDVVSIDHYRWESRYNGLYQLSVAASFRKSHRTGSPGAASMPMIETAIISSTNQNAFKHHLAWHVFHSFNTSNPQHLVSSNGPCNCFLFIHTRSNRRIPFLQNSFKQL